MEESSTSSHSAGLRLLRSSLLVAAIIFATPAAAQATNEASVSMKIDVVAWGDSIGGLSFKAGDKKGKITARSFTYSKPVKYNGPATLAIYQSGDGNIPQPESEGTPDDEEHQSMPLVFDEEPESDKPSEIAVELGKRREKEPNLVALIQLPSNSRHATVLLAPAASGTFRGFVINDDPSQLPPGKLHIHNLSKLPISLQLSTGEMIKMTPGKRALGPAANEQVIYRLSYKTGEKWKVQESNILPVPANAQTQFIVLQSNNRYFLSADGASGGHLQTVTLRRELQ